MQGMTRTTNGPAVRPMTADDDFESLNAGNPLAWQPKLWREMAQAGEIELHWFTGLLDGRPAGMGVVCPLGVVAEGYGVGAVNVVPQSRRQGLGTALRAAVESAARGRVPGVQYSYSEGYADAEAAVAAWGLEESGRHRESILDLTTIDRDLFEAKVGAVGASGVVLETISSLDDLDDDGWHELHDYVVARFAEAPDAAGADEQLPYATFRRVLEEPWMLMTAKKDGRYVGVTFVMRRMGDTKSVNTLFTGVSPEARGQGVAAALKTRQALLLADRGVPRIYTQNMEGNLPILAANKTLGFALADGYVDVRQPLPQNAV